MLSRALPGVRVSVVGNVHPAVEAGPDRSGRTGLLFVGNANHRPNVDAVRWWRDEIAPLLAQQLPGVQLTVVGNDPVGALRELQGPGIRVLGWVPETRPHLDEALVSVAPLRYGAGMKGKLGEAMAAGLPVVATTIAAEGMELVQDEHALLASDAPLFAAAVVRLHEDAQLWERLRGSAREHVDAIAGEHAVHRQLRELLGGLDRPPRGALQPRKQRRAAAKAAARAGREGAGAGADTPACRPTARPSAGRL